MNYIPEIVSLDSEGNIYGQFDGKIFFLDNALKKKFRLEFIADDPYQHFFKIPFTSISYIKNGIVKDTMTAHPSSFYPGSPFDTFMAVNFNTGKICYHLPVNNDTIRLKVA